ncbi:uncharacterized protein N7483_005091 [Penicillium malachiteum]|uniref:uncharacterized protein n=1 Tax=Penicillium malachiteum TaxID=1324776 RepID=UPI0025471F20|nr:uncharacterized protein N7483_005091 [Penicillium malachiteum]KAJ5730583.1 hypothetical protein N7483_005091 [Penicillium malachiteum]
MSAMDCGAAKMPNNACFPAPIQTHIKSQDSYSSALSHDAIAIPEPIPSPRRWSPTYQPRRRSRQFPTLSFVPSPTLPRAETHEYSTTSLSRRPVSRGPSCISPFRSVRKMKEPFQLMLPTSPASCDNGPTFRPKSSRESKPLPNGRTLRTWRSDQNLTCTSMSAFGLLPSPPMSESRPASAGADSSSSYFESKNDVKEEDIGVATSDRQSETSDEPNDPVELAESIGTDDRINYMAYHPPGWKDEPREPSPEQRWTEVTNVHEAHSNLVRQCDANETKHTATDRDEHARSISSPPSIPGSNLIPGSSPRPHRPRTATVSSEASWIPSNLAYCETWLKGVPFDPMTGKDENVKESNRRKVQIVEQDPPVPKVDFIPGMKSLDEPLRFAVASKPKNKPRLVDIARQSSPAMPPPPSLMPHPLPMTPDHRHEEVSAFSPDTPLDISDNGYDTRTSGYSLESYEDAKDDDAFTDPGSLTSDSVTSTIVGERPETAQGERYRSPQPEIRSGSVSPEVRLPIHHRLGQKSNHSDKEESEEATPWDDANHEWTLDDHEWTLDELEHSVKDFPRHMLRLTSPAILHVRKSDDRDFLRPFRTIFPDVTENLLDCLCAALIARNYLLSLSTIHRHKPSLLARNDIYGIDAIPTKAYSTLGIQLPSGSPGRIKDRFLGSRSADLRRDVERIIDNLLFAICGRSDETLKSAIEVLAQVLEVKAP